MPYNVSHTLTVESLPREILTKIFLLAVSSVELPMPANSVDSDTTSQELSDSPLRLSWVNRRWNFITRRTPRLWTHIHVSHRRTGEALLTYLTLSNDAPLDVTVRWLPSFSRLPPDGVEVDAKALRATYYQAMKESFPAFNAQGGLLLQHAKRWRSLRLVLDDPWLMEVFLKRFSIGSTPQLITLDLRYVLPHQDLKVIVAADQENDGIVAFAGIQHANIAHLRLDGVSLAPPLPSLESLTTLKLHNLDDEQMPQLPELIPMLRGLPNLRRLSFYSYIVADEYPLDFPASDTVCLTALEKLSISHVCDGWPEYFILCVYFPNVRRLTFDIWEAGFYDFLQFLHDCYEDFTDLHMGEPRRFHGLELSSVEGLQLAQFGGNYRADGAVIDEKDFFNLLKNVRFLVLDVQGDKDHISRFIEYTRQLTASDTINPEDSLVPSSTTCMPLLGTVLLLGIEAADTHYSKDLVKTRKEMGAPIDRLLIQLHRGRNAQSMITDSDDSRDDVFTAEDVAWLKANVAEVLIFDKVQLPNREGIDDMLDLLFEVEDEMAAGSGLKFVDVFCDLLEL